MNTILKMKNSVNVVLLFAFMTRVAHQAPNCKCHMSQLQLSCSNIAVSLGGARFNVTKNFKYNKIK